MRKENLQAKDMIGCNYNNYLGINNVTDNPASIAANWNKFHFNLFSVNGYSGNNSCSVDKGNGSFFDFNQLRERGNTKDEKKNGWANVDILGPTFLLDLN